MWFSKITIFGSDSAAAIRTFSTALAGHVMGMKNPVAAVPAFPSQIE